MSQSSRVIGAALAAALACWLAAPPVQADTFVLKDGRTLDGKVVKEDAHFVWVKTLVKTEKLALAQVSERTEGVSSYERAGELEKQIKADPTSAAAHWELYRILATFADKGVQKRAQSMLKKVIKLSPNHTAAREANGDVQFQGEWVKKVDLPRLKAEFERRKLKREWSARLRVPVEVYQGEHWLLLDNTKDKDLAGRAEALDQAYDALTDLFGVEGFWEGRAPVITIKKYAAYLRVLEEYQKTWRMKPWWVEAAKNKATGGVWRQKPDPIQLRWLNTGEEAMWSAIIHNTAHVAMWKHYRSVFPPAWLDEGLGAWVEIEVTDEQISSCVAKSDNSRGKTTDRKKRKGKAGKSLVETHSEWKEIFIQSLEEGEFPPLRKFLNMKLGEFGPPEEGGALGLVTWLVNKDREAFKKLIGLLMSKGKPDPIWKETYDFLLIEDMEKAFKIWALSEW